MIDKVRDSAAVSTPAAGHNVELRNQRHKLRKPASGTIMCVPYVCNLDRSATAVPQSDGTSRQRTLRERTSKFTKLCCVNVHPSPNLRLV